MDFTEEKAMTRVFAMHPVYDNIFSRLSPLSLIIRMANLSHDIKAINTDFTTRAYNINRRLAYFFSEPLAFRALMARTYMIISGSFVLQFLDRTHYPGSDLDLYVHPDDSILDICLWLEQEGYVYVPASRQSPILRVEITHIRTSPLPFTDVEHHDVPKLYANMSSLRGILCFERSPSQDPCNIRQSSNHGLAQQPHGGNIVFPFQHVASSRLPTTLLIPPHAACVMNIVTYNAAYSLYPYATFEERTSLVVLKVTERTQLALDKYASRGLRILDNILAYYRFAYHLERA